MGAQIASRPLANVSYVGSAFFMAWMNGAFFTSAVSSLGASSHPIADTSGFWNLSLLGVFIGLIALTAAEGRFGQLALNRRYLVAGTSAVCAGTALMVLSSVYPGAALQGLACVGAFMTGLFSASFYIAWSHVYGSLDSDDAELMIPLSVALSQLLSIVFCALQGWAAVICLVCAPAVSVALLLACFRLVPGGVSAARFDGVAADAAPGPDVVPGASSMPDAVAGRPAQPHGLLSPACGLLFAALWLVLSVVTLLVGDEGVQGGLEAMALAFVVSFVALSVLLFLYVNFSKRLSMLQAARIAVPLVVASLLLLLLIPTAFVHGVFLLIRATLMFFWAIVWICCVKLIAEGRGTATRVMGTARGWIQGGAICSLLLAGIVVHGGLSLSMLVYLCVTLLVGAFAVAVPALVRASASVASDVTRAQGASDYGAPRHSGGSQVQDDQDDEAPASFEQRCALLAERYKLTPRELEIAAYLLRGRDLPFIRDTLFISRNTINTHVRHIYGKLGIHSKQELIDRFEGDK